MYNVEAVVEKIEHGDVLEIKKLLERSKAVLAENVSREVLSHLDGGVALKLVVDGKIAGVWCSLDMGEYVSLSYFYIREDMRGSLWVLKLFKMGIIMGAQDKPLMIETKDTAGFDKYVEHVEGNVYVFKGFR